MLPGSRQESSDVAAVAEFATAACCEKFAYRVVKRGVDIAGAGVALLALSPLFAVIALAVKLSSRGPVFYRWNVVGRGGRRFTGWKFRSMVANADEQKKDLWQYNLRRGPTFKMKNDPRVTSVGRILRRFSLDELPQLWSVLRGDMSLVGPRPVSRAEWQQFEGWQRRKLAVTPGMISLWHVSGKPEEFNEWIRLDLQYVDKWSLKLDLAVLTRGLVYLVAGIGER